MTTKEIYFSLLELIDLPISRVSYWIERLDLMCLDSVCLELRSDETTANKSINKMKQTEMENGFKFWAVSPEGRQFLKENHQVIANELINITLNQK